jgi:HEAT repeats
MSRSRVLLVPVVLASLVAPAQAGIFSRGKPKANPAERVPELLIQLKTDPDESKRAAAAEELRQYDPNAYPEIMTTLMDALAKDMGTSVRSEAATSLGKLRPISQQAGFALEQATANDGSMRVRMAARQALWQYHLVGYRSGKPVEMPARPAEPAVSAPPGPSTPAAAMARTSKRVATGPFRETPEPPLAEPLPAQPAPTVASTPAPPQRVPSPAALVPVNTPKTTAPPAVPASGRKPAKGAGQPVPPNPAEQPPAAQPKPVASPPTAKGDGPELPF